MYNKASISVKSNKQLKVINPLAEFLYFRLFFSSWKNFTMILKKKSESYLLDGTNPRFLSFSRTNESQSNQYENLKMIQEENNEDSGHFPSESNLEEEKETTIKHSRMQNNREVFQNLDGTFNDYSRGEL